MFTWSTVALLAFVLVSSTAVPLLKVYENEQALDPYNQMYLRWSINNETNTIDIEILANCTGWLGISFAEGLVGVPGSRGDIIMAGFNDEMSEGYVEVNLISNS